MKHLFRRIALFLLCFPWIPYARAGVIELPSVPSSSIVLVNSAQMPLAFSVRPENGEWSELQMQPGQNITYTCNQCTTPSFEFIMKTDDKQVRYNLTPAKRYLLKWSDKKALWDIFEVD